ncbi:flavin-dependent dehydrogenase [Herbihabitans rhizosphaerae]|uniref:Flavin-dependent dehydrogenase n=1 Tax=Herbihabitans rhizosphaerae TaxID=1872711 RepID=A0A4Q7L4D8_9PSEU|nr:NAD(P)/FAD-dependent oxidoreductase [Herbihabitans rhizosphaerae]RZS43062.1 flavin-dependent dehydrogenase [Herbihabitans rhizosphaerae]
MDVAVIGTGPAGCSAAARLAGAGLDVVLIGHRPDPEDGPTVLVSSVATAHLESCGITIDAVRTEVVEVVAQARAQPARIDFPSVTVNRGDFVAHLYDSAVARGARVVTARSTDTHPSPDGVVVALDDGEHIIARHVVLATGAGQTGSRGIARTQLFRGVDTACPALHLSTPSDHDPGGDRLAVWVLPAGANTAAITVVSPTGADEDDLIDRALAIVAERDPRFAGAEAIGVATSGPIDTGFDEAAARDGHVLAVGDAAGLVNPFTGEGITHAVESALVAAAAIEEHPDSAELALRRFAREMTGRFAGRTDLSRAATRRYHFAWRTLTAAVDSDHPFLVKGRRAMVAPEGVSAVADPALLDLDGPERITVGPFLLACDEVLLSSLRSKWPFLARLATSGDTITRRRLRPAILFGAGVLAGTDTLDVTLAPLAAAIELASLAALAFVGTPPAEASDGTHTDWATTSVLLGGDFLLAEASRLVARHSPAYSFTFAEWLDELVATRTGRLTAGTPAADVFASIFEFPLRIGAAAGDCSPAVAEELRSIGTELGGAFLRADEALALRGERTRLEIGIDSLVGQGISELSADEVADPPRTADRLTVECHAHADRALATLTPLGDNHATRLLREFVSALIAPVRTGGPARVPR